MKDVFLNLDGSWICPWISHWMQRIRVEPRNPLSLFEGASIFVQVFCCQAEALSWIAKDKLHPALNGETAQVSSASKALGYSCLWSGQLWMCPCTVRGTYRLDLSGMQGSRLSTEMARTGKSNSIRSKKLVCKEKSQRTQDLHKTAMAGKEYLKASKYINIKEEEDFFGVPQNE